MNCESRIEARTPTPSTRFASEQTAPRRRPWRPSTVFIKHAAEGRGIGGCSVADVLLRKALRETALVPARNRQRRRLRADLRRPIPARQARRRRPVLRRRARHRRPAPLPPRASQAETLSETGRTTSSAARSLLCFPFVYGPLQSWGSSSGCPAASTTRALPRQARQAEQGAREVERLDRAGHLVVPFAYIATPSAAPPSAPPAHAAGRAQLAIYFAERGRQRRDARAPSARAQRTPTGEGRERRVIPQLNDVGTASKHHSRP